MRAPGADPNPCEEMNSSAISGRCVCRKRDGTKREGRQKAWGRGVENGSLVFCADFRPDVEVSHEWVPDLGGPGRGVTLLTGPPLALPLTRSPGTLRAEFPFRRITRRTPQFTLTSLSHVSMCLSHNCPSGRELLRSQMPDRDLQCFVRHVWYPSTQAFYPHLQLVCFTRLSPSRDARIHYA